MIRLEQERCGLIRHFGLADRQRTISYRSEKKKLLRHWILQKKKDFLTM